MIKTIFFDFDGVILDSMRVRLEGFKQVFEGGGEEAFEKFEPYHLENGGISRFVKIRYFYEEILKRPISEDEVMEIAAQFSILMKKELISPKYLIEDSMDFIRSNYTQFPMHIASGAEHNELLYLCQELKIDHFFQSIHGSPQPKHEVIRDLMERHDYNPQETVLIGDSIRDFEAADQNGILFYGFNNEALSDVGDGYIRHFEMFRL